MTACFADTFYFLAMVNPHDAAYPRVSQFNASFRGPLLTTAWVLTEVADALAHTANRPLFQILYVRLQSDRRVTIVQPTTQLFESGIDLYNDRRDKRWSLTDCISFLVMRQHGLTEALTGDHHFEQAGFTLLLK